jgi:hypothetical protein
MEIMKSLEDMPKRMIYVNKLRKDKNSELTIDNNNRI